MLRGRKPEAVTSRIGERATVFVPLTINGKYALLHLKGGKVARVDIEQWESVRRFRWCASSVGKGRFYVKTADPMDLGKGLYLHRLIARAPAGVHVDHRNSNPLDCRLDNLRWCTNAENSANQRKRAGSSRFKGVHWSKKSKRWVASIHANYGTQFLGHFDREEGAAIAYDAAAVKAFGIFAKLNFPEGVSNEQRANVHRASRLRGAPHPAAPAHEPRTGGTPEVHHLQGRD